MRNMNVANINICILIFATIYLISVGGFNCKRIDSDGNWFLSCCKDYVEKDGKCISCPDGFTSENGRNCSPCELPFYGRHCSNECICMKDDTCHHVQGCVQIIIPPTPVSSKTTSVLSKNKDCPEGFTSTNGGNCSPCQQPFYGRHCVHQCKCTEDETCHHLNGCVQIITTQSPLVSSKTAPELSRSKEVLDLGICDKTMYYVALGCVVVMAVLIGMLLKSVKNKYCCTRKSRKIELPQEAESRLADGVSSSDYGYDFIDELHLIENNAAIEFREALNEMSEARL